MYIVLGPKDSYIFPLGYPHLYLKKLAPQKDAIVLAERIDMFSKKHLACKYFILIDYSFFIISLIANLSVLLYCDGKQQPYIKKPRSTFFFSLYLITIDATSHTYYMWKIFLYFFFYDQFYTLLHKEISSKIYLLSLLLAILSSSPTSFFLSLPSTQLLCSWANENWPRRPSLMTHLVTARSFFSMDIIYLYQLVLAAL